jgi:hypothetical protein
MKTIQKSILVAAAVAALCGQAQADGFRGHGQRVVNGGFNRAFSTALGVGVGLAVVDAIASPYRFPSYSTPVYQNHVREMYFSSPGTVIAYAQPQFVYTQPQVVYAQPQVVSIQPQVIYAQPQVVQLPPQVVYSTAPGPVYPSVQAQNQGVVPGVTFGVPIQLN